MRDIRDDLMQRSLSIAARYADAMVAYADHVERLHREHRELILALSEEKALVDGLLEIENRRARSLDAATASPPAASSPSMPLQDFILTKIHAEGPITKEELRAEAQLAGYFQESNGRTFHITLKNIATGGKIKQLPDGGYVHSGAMPNLFGLDQTRAAPMITN